MTLRQGGTAGADAGSMVAVLLGGAVAVGGLVVDVRAHEASLDGRRLDARPAAGETTAVSPLVSAALSQLCDP